MPERLGIIGAGKIGTAIARAAVATGIDVGIAGSGGVERLALTAEILAPGATPMTTTEATDFAEVVVLAVPVHRFRSIAPDSFDGKILIDVMNHWEPVDGPDLEMSSSPDGSSVVVQAHFPGARVVKSLNQLGYHEFDELARPGGAPDRVGVAVASDDADARATVAHLVDRLGFDPVELESLAEGRVLGPEGIGFGVALSASELRGAIGGSLQLDANVEGGAVTIRSPFTKNHTADEVSDGIDLTGMRAVVTGGASGIGVETARTLARRGADVTIAARRIDLAEHVAQDIRTDTGNPGVHVSPLELTDRRSISDFADRWTGRLDLLIDNAGVMRIAELTRDADGHELQFATNYLGHFDLTARLRPALADSREGARVVIVSSSGHLFSPVVFDDIDYRFRPYDPLSAYGQSKTAEVLLAVGITQRWADDGIVANALNPGAIATKLQRHVGGTLATPPELQKTVQQGASTSIFAAVSPLLAGIGGIYLNDNAEAAIVDERPTDPAALSASVARYALDAQAADRLWEQSERMLRR